MVNLFVACCRGVTNGERRRIVDPHATPYIAAVEILCGPRSNCAEGAPTGYCPLSAIGISAISLQSRVGAPLRARNERGSVTRDAQKARCSRARPAKLSVGEGVLTV